MADPTITATPEILRALDRETRGAGPMDWGWQDDVLNIATLASTPQRWGRLAKRWRALAHVRERYCRAQARRLREMMRRG